MSLGTMFDSVNVSGVPAGAEIVAGYIDGRFSNMDSMIARFPHARHLSICVNGRDRANVLDIESGDAVPDTFPGWFHALSEPPHIAYAPASEVGAVIAAAEHAGIGREAYVIWSAHVGRGKHICSPGVCGFPQADGTQWLFAGSFDQSIVTMERFFPESRPHPSDPFHYSRYPTGPFLLGGLKLNERATVEEYDRILGKRGTGSRVAVLRAHIEFLRDRIAFVAEYDSSTGDPWKSCFRDWRWKKLDERLRGKVTF